ncbi:MAG: hypothetical protein IKK29_06140 [Christensenellaceae bacterium]|nr:hypothetical protein [Christensenellaceae bacterium]
MPTEITGGFIAEEFRVMNNELLEVVYRDGDYEVTVRKALGEDQDISGLYAEFGSEDETEREGAKFISKSIDEHGSLTLVSYKGYSYSLYAPNGFWGDSAEDFIIAVLASE